MTRVLVFDQRRGFAGLLKQELEASDEVETCLVDQSAWSRPVQTVTGSSSVLRDVEAVDTLIYSAPCLGRTSAVLDLDHVRAVFARASQVIPRQVVLISSAAVYHPKYGNPGLMRESRPTTSRWPNEYAEQWQSLEHIARQRIPDDVALILTILRPAPLLIPSARDFVGKVFQRRWVLRFVGYDPSIQLLDETDLARAIVRAVECPVVGTFNVAPRGVMPLRKALRRGHVRSLALPRLAQRLVRRLLRFRGVAPIDQADFVRYSFTISGDKAKQVLGFEATKSTANALADYVAQKTGDSKRLDLSEEFDDFGLDEQYLQWHGRWLLRFLERIYWRIDIRGTENIPTEGGAILVGIHRGFMPLDGVLFIHLANRYSKRVPRFLMHPALVKFPVLASFLMKIGGIIATEKNADIVLGRGQLLGVFPEGIRGAFRMYRDAYRLDDLGRNDYVKFALRHQVPIVPFVYLGPAETFPILARVDWPWWKRLTDWPFFPITLTWPWLPIPLPTRWRLRILEPISPTQTRVPDKMEDRKIVESIANQVRDEIQRNLIEMRKERNSIVWERWTSTRDNR